MSGEWWCDHIKMEQFYKSKQWAYNGCSAEYIKYEDDNSVRGDILERKPWMFCPLCGTPRPEEKMSEDVTFCKKHGYNKFECGCPEENYLSLRDYQELESLVRKLAGALEDCISGKVEYAWRERLQQALTQIPEELRK